MVAVHEEREVKYDVEEGVELPGLDAVLDGVAGSSLVLAETSTYRLQATYFDTADRSLGRAGLTLRRRTGGADAGWHLKVPNEQGARTEVRLPLGRPTVPARLQQMLWARTRGQELVAVAVLHTLRTVQLVTDRAGTPMVELADDRVEGRRLASLLPQAPSAEEDAVSWREVEVEAIEAGREVFDAVDRRLRDLGLRVSETASKLQRVMGDRSVSVGDRIPERLTAQSAAGQVVRAYLSEQVEQIVSRDILVRLDVPDSVHKMRVATRRVRSALKTFRPLLAREQTNPVRAELKWLAAQLGAARDAEVLRMRLRHTVESLGEPPGDDPAPALGSRLGGEYDRAHQRLVTTLNSARYHRLLEALSTLVVEPPVRRKGIRPASAVLPKRVARSYGQLRALVKQIADAPADEQDHLLHEARKAAKQARYAGEAVTSVFGDDAAAFASAMEAVQEELGEHQDSVVTRAKLRHLLSGADVPTAFTLGRLYAVEEARARESTDRFERTWAASSQKSLRAWLK
ncbi:MAG TPA: CYTH and CHAD domain-containing protein [Dermatophilaceae bacterium]|nr:CYTH and CHAD domain-containing protein [Dermatophilaceae bacterium]